MQIEEVVNYFRSIGPFALEYSGGKDSTVLAALAVEAFEDNTVAITAVTPLIPEWELEMARKMAKDIGIKMIEVEYSEMDNEDFVQNTRMRCYHCRSMRAERILEAARESGFTKVADGVNTDDLEDFRPGIKAADERGYIHPFVELGLGKNDLIVLGTLLGLEMNSIPSGGCIASRITPMERITSENIEMVSEAERFLMDLGFQDYRVRYHSTAVGPMARIEMRNPKDLFSIDRTEVIRRFRDIGFKLITLDIEGYRPSGMLLKHG